MSAGEHERSASERREALKEVLAQARGCGRCPELAETRRTVVFGSGNADADLMFIGEAPGASEDEQGVPFVGRAGKLLTQRASATRQRDHTHFLLKGFLLHFSNETARASRPGSTQEAAHLRKTPSC